MNRDQAAEEFVKAVTFEGFTEGKNVLLKLLQGPVGHDREEWIELRKWMSECSPDQQRLFKLLIEEAIRTSLFQVFAFLDGTSGFHEVEQKPAAFAVSLNVYRDFEDIFDNKPDINVQIVPADGGDFLHDLFFNLLDDMKNPNE